MKCCIVKDLLPGYIDSLTSEETNEEIKQHLKDCADCTTICPQMGAVVPSALAYKLNSVCSSGSCPDNRPQPALESHQDAQKSITSAL